MTEPTENGSALYEALKALESWQLDELLKQAQAPREFFSPAMVAAAQRATEVVKWASQAADRPTRIRAALERVSPLLVAAAELLKWQSWCYREFRRVPLVGFENRERVYLDLDDIFVPLRVSPALSPRGEGRVGVDKRSVKGDEALAPEAQADVEARELTIVEALQETERARAKNPALVGLALIGDPGAGKTTLLRHVYCRVMREGSATLGLPQGLVPVLMRFSRLESIERRPRALADALRKEAEANGYPGAAEPLLASDRKLLVLLDGLDEVRDEATRVELSQWLEREIEHWDGAGVSSRRAGQRHGDASSLRPTAFSMPGSSGLTTTRYASTCVAGSRPSCAVRTTCATRPTCWSAARASAPRRC